MSEQNTKPVTSGGNAGTEELEKHLLWQADQFAAVWEVDLKTPKEKLEYLRESLQKMRLEIKHLEIGWAKSIPALHEGMLLYYLHMEGKPIKKKSREFTSALIEAVVHLSQSGGLRKRMLYSFEQQIKDVEAIIRIKYTDPENMNINSKQKGGELSDSL